MDTCDICGDSEDVRSTTPPYVMDLCSSCRASLAEIDVADLFCPLGAADRDVAQAVAEITAA